MKRGLLLGIGILAFSWQANAVETKAKYALLMDADTGYVMFDKKADEAMHPASMSKLMTSYLVEEAIKSGKYTEDTEFTVSENAWRKGGAKTGGSTMFLKIGQKVKLIDLLKGINIQSGNDACIVVAEGMAGTEEAFAAKMTQKAKKLGLTKSTFANATGIPDPNHLMSARDLALLSQHIINDFPEYYPIYSQKEFTYNGIKQGNRNPLLYSLQGADGLKTGHTSQSGYGLTATVKAPDGRRLILVINGLSSMNDRASEARNLMNYGLSHFENVTVLDTNKAVLFIPVWMGTKAEVMAYPAEKLIQTHPMGEEVKISSVVEYQEPVLAPVQKGQKLGTITTTLPDGTVHEMDLIAGESVEKLGFFARLKKRLFGG
ncbi:MAG: D-alanyl-D-alanine carboxypeptidase family protein [Alphaproteobacteria bacterium]